MPSDVLQYTYHFLSKGAVAMTDNITTTADQTTQPQSDMPAQDELTPFEKKEAKRKRDWLIWGPILCPLGYVIVLRLPTPDWSMFICCLGFLLISLYALWKYLLRCKYFLKHYKLHLILFWCFTIFIAPLFAIYIFIHDLYFATTYILAAFLCIYALVITFYLKRFPCDRNGYFHKPTKKEE